MVHGQAKIGKTVLLSTAPNPVILSAERGLLSLRKQNIPFYDIATAQQFRDAMAWIRSSAEARQFASIGVDSFTEIARILLRDNKKSDARQKYGDMQEELSAALRELRDLPGPNVIAVFQSESYKDEALGTAVWMPTVPGQSLKPEIPYLMDEVFYMTSMQMPDGKEYRVLRTQPDYRTMAGDRSGALDAIEPPNLTAIFAKIAAA